MARARVALEPPRRPARAGASGPADGTPSAIELDRAERRRIRQSYFRGLGAWAIAWAPLSLIVLFEGPAGLTDGWALVALPLGVLGAAFAVPFFASARSRLQNLYGFSAAESIAGRRPDSPRLSYERVGWAASFSYASWVAGGVLALTALLAAVGSDTTSVSLGGTEAGVSVDPGWLIVGTITVVFVALRALFHYHLARAASTPPTGASPAPSEREGMGGFRTQVGAVLLTLNPFVGLLLGLGFQSVIPWSPFLLAWVFLPVTYLGIAVLSGCFGPTAWSGMEAEGAAPRVTGTSAASPGAS